MACCSTVKFTPLQQNQHLLFITLSHYKFPCSRPEAQFRCSPQIHAFSKAKRTTSFKAKSSAQANSPARSYETRRRTVNSRTTKGGDSGVSTSEDAEKRVENHSVKGLVSLLLERTDSRHEKGKNARKYKQDIVSGDAAARSGDENGSEKRVIAGEESRASENAGLDKKKTKKTEGEKTGKASNKKSKAGFPDIQMRLEFDMCSKRGDVMRAIELYDWAQREGISMGQYQYSVILYLCSSAAVGVVQPAKSGNSGSRSSNARNLFDESPDRSIEEPSEVKGKGSKSTGSTELDDREKHYNRGIQVSEDLRKYALKRGLEIYEKMRLQNIPMNESTLTAVARMAMSMGNGDMAFDMVKQMTQLGINPKLRSYAPALSSFCEIGDVEKAFCVEKHMLEHGVSPEAPELEALLRASVEASKGDKVYYLLQKLRTTVRRVSPSAADTIVRWFDSAAASRVGKRKWNEVDIKEAVENGGGGWHGQGWLGKGKWRVSFTSIGPDASCRCCGEKLATIDLDPVETENFAESVASIAVKRDKDSSFMKFKKWLDYYGPFEAVIDGANVGLSNQTRFMPSKINAVFNGIRQKLPSKKRPLIILHNRRISGPKMDQPVNKTLVEKWRNADALFATPTGSNDDWYWLYAAIKFKCLLVTNDEMRDHTFQLLGNDFFPKWKERHQVRFRFDETGPIFHMPPPYSVVIQESDKGHWHVPIAVDQDEESERAWLCITRPSSSPAGLASIDHKHEGSTIQTRDRPRPALVTRSNSKDTQHNNHREVHKNLTKILSTSGFQDHSTVLSQIETAEKLGNCIIDFQI
ncbi:unnamed protein product [Linum trigynum]|uniref:ribonuclease P n=1 Tax=Linum trigynum TaxID=586398 RepID=A0AAV2GUC6_9ROSI